MDEKEKLRNKIDRNEIKVYLLKKNYRVCDLASIMNICKSTASKKLNGKLQFNEHEVAILYKMGCLAFTTDEKYW